MLSSTFQPHKINFQVSNAWTPVSKMQGRAPATGANSEGNFQYLILLSCLAIVTRKRPSQFSDLNSPHERSNGSSFLMDSDDSDRRVSSLQPATSVDCWEFLLAPDKTGTQEDEEAGQGHGGEAEAVAE